MAGRRVGRRRRCHGGGDTGRNGGSDPGQYEQTNLISDIAGVALITDPNLVNPWGQAASATSPLWVADNGSDVSTLYSGGVTGASRRSFR